MSENSEKSHSCQFCQKIFKRRQSKIIHERVHTGEKPYVCDLCKKSFADSANLAKHKRTKVCAMIESAKLSKDLITDISDKTVLKGQKNNEKLTNLAESTKNDLSPDKLSRLVCKQRRNFMVWRVKFNQHLCGYFEW